MPPEPSPATRQAQTHAAAPLLMGILNVTPDSFSDGGRYTAIDQAVAHGLAMAQQGAAIIDVGGESTRPGSERVPATEQIARVIEPIRRLRDELNRAGMDHVVISIDTTLSDVARAAIDAGAGMLNDVSAGREDERMFALAAEHDLPIILMHMLGSPGTMQKAPQYDDAVQEVRGFLLERAEAAVRAGVARQRVWIDPGIGFGKTLEHNLALLGGLKQLVETGLPVLLGVSRKRFIAGCCAGFVPLDTPESRLPGTLAAGLIGVVAGVAGLRVHDVAEHRQALAVWSGAN